MINKEKQPHEWRSENSSKKKKKKEKKELHKYKNRFAAWQILKSSKKIIVKWFFPFCVKIRNAHLFLLIICQATNHNKPVFLIVLNKNIWRKEYDPNLIIGIDIAERDRCTNSLCGIRTIIWRPLCQVWN